MRKWRRSSVELAEGRTESYQRSGRPDEPAPEQPGVSEFGTEKLVAT